MLSWHAAVAIAASSVIGLLVSTFSLPAAASAIATNWPIPDLPLTAHLDQPVFSVAAERDLLFAGSDSSVSTYSISDAANPTLLGRSLQLSGTDAHVDQIVPRGTILFVLAERALHVLDVTQPATPIEIAHPLSIDAVDMVVQASLLYAAGGDALTIVDVNDPTDPRIVGRLAGRRSSQAVAVAGSTAFVAPAYSSTGALTGQWIVDVSDPTHPSIVGADPHPANALATDGSNLYLSWQIGSVKYSGPRGMTILDISDPSRPSAVAYLPTPGNIGTFRVRVSEGYAALTDEQGVFVADVSDPTYPQWIGYHTGGTYCIGTTCYLGLSQVAIHGNVAYVSEGQDGLSVLELPAHGTRSVTADQRITSIDGRRLAGEPQQTQDLFRVVWRANAATQWAIEHSENVR
jgi:hypothetical protein